MLILLLVITVIITNSLAFYVAVKNHFSRTSLYHLMAAFLLSLWAVTNVTAESYSGYIGVNTLLNRLAFVFAFLGGVGFVLFSRSFIQPPNRRKWPAWKQIVVWGVTAGFAGLAFSDLIAGTVERNNGGDLVFLQGPLVALYVVAFLVIVGLIIRNLLIRTKRGNYAEKNQARFIIFGWVTLIAVGLSTNIIIPSFNPEFTKQGYVAVLMAILLVLPTSYALIKHRLLDVRPLAARGISLILLLVTLGAVYAGVLLWLNEMFLADYNLSGYVLVFYAAVMITLGFLLHPIYSLYNRWIGQIFLRRVYDSQKVINELNNVLVANLKLRALMPELQRVIRSNLDARFTIIKLHRRGAVFHQGKPAVLSNQELAELDLALSGLSKKSVPLLSIRDIAVDPQQKELANLMLRHRLAVVGAIKQGSTPLGMIYISVKNSELPYTNQDLDIINIILSQAGLAIQNALLYQEVSTFNDTLQKRVDGATRELRQTNSKLLAIDKAKDEFISIASHQLRTPLTTVKGYLSMLLEGGMGKVSPEQRTVLQQSFDSSERMAYVVSDLLNLMRLRTGKFSVDTSPTNLAEVVESELSYIQEQAKHKNLSVVFEKPANFPILMLDDTKLRQVIKNFVYNALFYTLPGGSVTVELSEQTGNVFFRVKDTGIGVPKEEQKHLFTQFYRAKNARDIRPDGTGVGLFISKKVIAAHHGTILFESVEGKGSTFGFSLSKKLLAVPKTDE